MRAHLSNAAYGILDYGAYPIGMLVVAPIVLRNLGIAQYGIWTFATAAVSIGGIVASGFGDANIQHVASRRGANDERAALQAVRSMMAINLAFGLALACAGWMLSPLAASRVAGSDAVLQHSCLWSLRISILGRILALVAAAVLTYASHSVIAIMAATGLLMSVALWLQLLDLKRLLSADSLMPAFDRDTMRSLAGFGVFSMLQAVSGIVFSQLDRMMLGVSLGAAVVASYSLCAQMAQPIFGFAAAGLHFLFPYLSKRNASSSTASIKNPVLIAFVCNLIFVALTTCILLSFGVRIMHFWVGSAVAQAAAPVLPIIIWSSALLGMNVTATYALLALGRVRIVTWFNLLGGAAMLILMMDLTPRLGVQGMAIARLSYGIVPLFLYIPLLRHLFGKPASRRPISVLQPVGEPQ
jgi:O-antigen/teichoic acid export membrane protein